MVQNAGEVVSRLRATFESGKTKSIKFRMKQLKAIRKMLVENQEGIAEALGKDLHKNKHEAILMEINTTLNDLDYIIAHIKDWVKPDKPGAEFANLLDKAYIIKEPYGVVLIMGAWNYPFYLALSPVVGALAAGNCVVLKPSEISSASSKYLVDLVSRYLDKEVIHVYEGGIPETTELLKQRFDYIFYTGNTAVGRIIHAAANKFLTPITLELGGKSPTYLDKSANLETAVKRIMWGKLVNSGQTCVAPDYLLCTKEVEEKFVPIARRVIQEYYGQDPKQSPDYGRIVTEKHVSRLNNLLKESTIAVGGQTDTDEKYVAPTIVTNITKDHPLMQEEIFGPILPIVNVKDVNEAIDIMKSFEKPLALYIFSENKKDTELILKKVSSGGVGINDTIMHILVHTLPFGGVGSSGMGGYHGKYSFDTFSHKRSVLEKNLGFLGEKLSEARYPPYTMGKLRYLDFMLKPNLFSFKYLAPFLMVGLGILTFAWRHYSTVNSRMGPK